MKEAIVYVLFHWIKLSGCLLIVVGILTAVAVGPHSASIRFWWYGLLASMAVMIVARIEDRIHFSRIIKRLNAEIKTLRENSEVTNVR
jgi:UDP-N-acetylmuramyl pentapeptide phosphotransferase/UDP-N-acetylglucosamine-1-phosphate transferase